MEARCDIMTDNQWDGMIKMFMMMVCESESQDQILQKLTLLLKDRGDVEKILSDFKKQKVDVIKSQFDD